MIPVFEKAKQVLAAIENAGFEAYFVGGSVRDFLLQRQIEDVDIAASATPDEIKKIFPKTLDVGIEHGTVIVIFKGTPYEITTFRTEQGYEDFRRPAAVTFVRSLPEDLKRRDFTMNAIAMDKNGEIIDPFQGQKDLKEKLIKTVGTAEERFSEDALRMMRAIRFVSQLSFSLEDKTKKAVAFNKHLLKAIAAERKTAEFEKLLKGVNRRKAFQLLLETELYAFLPGLEGYKRELKRFVLYPFEDLSSLEMWALLIYSLGMDRTIAENFLRKWKLSVKKIKILLAIISALTERLQSEWTSRRLFDVQKEVLIHTERIYCVLTGNDFSSVEKWSRKYDALPIKDRSDLPVSGHELIEWLNKKSGPWIKDLYLKIENAVLNGELLNEKDKIREWVVKCNQN